MRVLHCSRNEKGTYVYGKCIYKLVRAVLPVVERLAPRMAEVHPAAQERGEDPPPNNRLPHYRVHLVRGHTPVPHRHAARGVDLSTTRILAHSSHAAEAEAGWKGTRWKGRREYAEREARKEGEARTMTFPAYLCPPMCEQ